MPATIFRFEKNDAPSVKKACAEKNFHYQAECSSRCVFPDGPSGAAVGVTRFRVVPMELGRLAVTVTSTRLDNGEVYRTRPEFDVALPDLIKIVPNSCFSADCEGDPVASQDPVLRIVVSLLEPGHWDTPEERRFPTTALRVNGVSIPIQADDAQRVSLADLFPDRRAGTGVEAGTYEIVASVGSKETHSLVVVH